MVIVRASLWGDLRTILGKILVSTNEQNEEVAPPLKTLKY